MALAMLGTALTGCGSKDAAAQTPAENTQQTAPVQQEQSQTEKALALINTFATGDTDAARSLLADGYIQHNLAYGTGADAFIGSVEYLASKAAKGCRSIAVRMMRIASSSCPSSTSKSSSS